MSIHPEMYGTCDFWTYDNGHLEVYDYKNGVQRVPVKDNLQLLAYAAMVEKTHGLLVNQVTLGIIQKGMVDLWQINDYNVYKTINRIEKIVERIEAAKDNPLKHLKEGTCDFFCPANKHHMARRENEQLTQATLKEDSMARSKLPEFTVKGKCIFYIEENERVKYSIAIDDAQLSAVKEGISSEYGTKDLGLINKQFKGSKEYPGASFYAGTKLSYLPESQRGINPKGKNVEVVFTVSIAAGNEKYPARAFLNPRSVEVLAQSENETAKAEAVKIIETVDASEVKEVKAKTPVTGFGAGA